MNHVEPGVQALTSNTTPLLVKVFAKSMGSSSLTYLELRSVAQRSSLAMLSLENEIYDLYEMCRDDDWSYWMTEDPLDIGELFCQRTDWHKLVPTPLIPQR